LTLQARWFQLWPFAGSFLAFSRASVFVLRRNAGGWWRRTVFLVFLDRFLARLDFGGVTRDRADDASPERAVDQRRMHPVGQIALRELREGAGKRGLGRNLCASFPTTDAAQRFVGAKAIDESAGGGNAEHGLGDEGARQAASILGRPAGSSRRLGNEGLEADHIENGDEPPKQFGHRLDFLTHPRKQGALDMIPTRPHGVDRIDHGFYRGARCLIRNITK